MQKPCFLFMRSRFPSFYLFYSGVALLFITKHVTCHVFFSIRFQQKGSMNFKKPPVLKIWLAFAAVYIIWGSTYFFIELVVRHVAPMLFGAFRFLTAGLMLLIWMILKKEKIWNKTAVLAAAISGCLMLFVGNGSVILAEQYLVSSFVAIFMASAPMWFLLLDKPKWAENFRNKFTLSGVLMGMVGVVFLFYEKVSDSHQGETPIWPLFAILVGNIGWVLGSLYSKYKTNAASPAVNSAWQMLSAGIFFYFLDW